MAEGPKKKKGPGTGADAVVEIVCCVDDMTAEHLAVAMEQLLDRGAIDVYAQPVLMKKGRCGYELTCMAHPGEEEEIGKAVLRYTTTAGLRFRTCPRLVKTVRFEQLETCFGPVTIKGYEVGGELTWKPEAEEVRSIACSNDLSFGEVSAAITAAIKAAHEQVEE